MLDSCACMSDFMRPSRTALRDAQSLLAPNAGTPIRDVEVLRTSADLISSATNPSFLCKLFRSYQIAEPTQDAQ